MLYLAENLKALRKGAGLTQDDVAQMLGVSPQSVSNWERADTYPDITLLPALANLFQTSIDALVGMDKINDAQARAAVFQAERAYLQAGDYKKAARVLEAARKTFPNDEGLMSELALAWALGDDADKLKQSSALC
ncbi:MAG: helix-turn-helix transcriptional regulator [Eubacteriales bacterium]|nr:helix-turn-helix transcriptional regulator [Eubacteriales bacterium]